MCGFGTSASGSYVVGSLKADVTSAVVRVVVVALPVLVATLTMRIATFVVLPLAVVVVSLAMLMVLTVAMLVAIVLLGAETTPADRERLRGNAVW